MKLATQTKTTYVLTLDEEEASTLMAILAYVSGDPETSRRKHANEIFQAFKKARLHYDDGDMDEDLCVIKFHSIE